MADISKIIVDSLQYNIKDTNARDRAETLETNMSRLNSDFSDLSDEVSEYESDVNALDALVEANTSDISTLQSNKVSKSGDTMTGALVNTAGVTGTPIISNGNLFIRNSGALYMNDGTNEHTILSNSTSNVLVNYGGRTLKHLGLYSVDGVSAPIAGFNLTDSYQIVTANGRKTVTAGSTYGASITLGVPSGYTAVAITRLEVSLGYAKSFSISNGIAYVDYYAESSGDTGVTVSALCLRTS